MTDLAVSALVRKRAELAGEIEARLAEVDRLRTDLVHLDAVICLMCPEAQPELIEPKRPSRKGCDWFGRGELGRLALDALRDAPGPLGSMASPAPSWRARAWSRPTRWRCGGSRTWSTGR